MDYRWFPSELIRASSAARLAQLVSSTNDGENPPVVGGTQLGDFIYSVITSSRARISAILVAYAYLGRAKSGLDPRTFGETWGQERIFIAALILATKYTEDQPRRNCQWARAARILTAREIYSAEMKLLRALDWDLSITEDEVLNSWTVVVGCTR